MSMRELGVRDRLLQATRLGNILSNEKPLLFEGYFLQTQRFFNLNFSDKQFAL